MKATFFALICATSSLATAIPAEVEKRQNPGATIAGVYACVFPGFGYNTTGSPDLNECVWNPVYDNKCVNFGIPGMASVGPDMGLHCAYYNLPDCEKSSGQPNFAVQHGITYGFDGNMNIGTAWWSNVGFTNLVSSYACEFSKDNPPKETPVYDGQAQITRGLVPFSP